MRTMIPSSQRATKEYQRKEEIKQDNEDDGVIAAAQSLESSTPMMVIEQTAVSQSYYHINIAEKSS